jgi:putative transposase
VESLNKNNKGNLQDFRKEFIPRDTELTDENIWMKVVPLDTREEAARIAIKALKTSFSLLKKGLISKFNLSFRSRKKNNNIFYVAKKALKDGKLFPRRLGPEDSKLRVRKKDDKYLKSSDGIFSIIQEKDKRYYICVIIKPEKEKVKPRSSICALDPGIRTFLTMYSEKAIGEFGYDSSKKLYQLYKREDRLKSVLASEKYTSKYRCKLKRRCALLRTKIKHIVQDLHWKTCDYLTKNYQVILLPIFNTKQMANKAKRKISKTTTRLMLGLSHYDFQQKLLYKAKQRGRQVILCKEHYTTKCCGNCGKLNDVGSKKVFNCSCGLKMDRDIHAARNILIRGLSIYFDSLSA